MKRIVEVTYSNSGKVNLGNFEQESPLYSLKSITEIEEEMDGFYAAEFASHKRIIDPLLAAHIQRVKGLPDHLRLIEIEGRKVPSVTSILSPEQPKIDPVLLEKYSQKGHYAEQRVEQYLQQHGAWLPLTPAEAAAIAPLKWDLPLAEWFATHEHTLSSDAPEYQRNIYHARLGYCGRADYVTTQQVVDWKSGVTQPWHLAQVVAYNEALPQPRPIVGIAYLKTGTFVLMPRTDPAYQAAWERFLVARGEFKGRYGY